jgi:ribose/xylose/arabinose/galactoside ABC-type transport system permease subunit
MHDMPAVTPPASARQSARRIAGHPLFAPALVLALLVLVGAATSPGFLRIAWHEGHLSGSLIDVLNRAAPLMLVSLGMMMVIAIRGIDISVGAVVAIAAAVSATLLQHATEASGISMLLLAIGGALLAAALCGAWNAVLVVKVGMQPIVATLILMIAGRGIAQLITDGQIVTIYYPPYFQLGNGFLLGIPIALIIAVAVALGLHLALSRTALGLFVRAIGLNPLAAHVAGVRARAIAFWLYVFCGLTAGIAGLIISSNVKSADGNNAGQLLELDAILAVAIGGTSLGGGRFTVAGTLLGALIIQTLTSVIYSSGLPPQANLAVKAVLVFAVLLLQSAVVRDAMRNLVLRPRREQ